MKYIKRAYAKACALFFEEIIMKMYQVDAFTTQLFKGNPAAVIILEDWLDEALMQHIALENNLSETAFVKKNTLNNYDIRWFTPTDEVPFCGHATLASAFILFQQIEGLEYIEFETQQLGTFYIRQKNEKIVMNFPILKAHPLLDYPKTLESAFNIPFKAVYLNDQAYVVEYENAQQVLDVQPDFFKLKEVSIDSKRIYGKTRDIVITAPGKDHYDCISRYFAPAIGVNEDPVTGSIHTAVIPLWAERLEKDLITAYQASSRGGWLYGEILPNDRIEISGQAKLYMVADIHI